MGSWPLERAVSGRDVPLEVSPPTNHNHAHTLSHLAALQPKTANGGESRILPQPQPPTPQLICGDGTRHEAISKTPATPNPQDHGTMHGWTRTAMSPAWVRTLSTTSRRPGHTLSPAVNASPSHAPAGPSCPPRTPFPSMVTVTPISVSPAPLRGAAPALLGPSSALPPAPPALKTRGPPTERESGAP